MRYSKKSAEEIALQQFSDFLVEETMNASDQEIIDQVREDYGDPNKLADEVNAIFEHAQKIAATRRFGRANIKLISVRPHGTPALK